MRRRFDRIKVRLRLPRRAFSGLGTKIAFGFAVVLALHIAVAAVGHVGISNARGNLELIDRDRHVNEEMVVIDRLVRELQQHVLLYMFAGHGSLGERVSSLHDELRVRITTATASGINNPDLVAMGAVLARYEDEFALAEDDRTRRDHLLNTLLVNAGARAAAALGALEETASQQRDRRMSLLASRLEREYLNARAEVLEYVHRLDYASVKSAIARLESCQRLLGVRATSDQPVEFDELAALFRDYEKLLHELIRRTRGYLHLGNVVIAGETVELLRLSNRVRERQSEQLDASYASILASQRWFENLSLWVSIVTIIAGLTASTVITKIVVKPLHAIATTFRELAAGNRDVAIPSRERRDEIGAMTRAAAVFKGKNDETAKLLEDTQRSNAELQQFAYVASHDLQEPLRMVASYVQLLEMRYADQLDGAAREYIDFAVDGTVRMKALIDDLLAYSRVGRAERRPVMIELADVVDVACANLRAAIEESGATIIHEQMPTIVADHGQLVQVLQNLLGNALKFRGDVPPEIHVGGREESTRWVLWVRDNGIGIDPDHTERIFTVFQRLHARDEYEGTGIGLAVCRRVVERHGGEVWVESREGFGATFFFSIAKSEDHQATASDANGANPTRAFAPA